jgi:hypothetical protein
VITGFVCSLLLIQVGCSIHPAGYSTSGNNSLLPKSADWPYSVEAVERSDGMVDYFWEIDSFIEQNDKVSLKYHDIHSSHKFAVVEGSMGPNGRKYPVVVDTGASQPLLVKQVHVRENNLRVQSLKGSDADRKKISLCYLPELDLDSIRLVDWPCLSVKTQSLGFGVRDDYVIMGLPLIREFKYVVFDNILGQIDESSSWTQFPIWLEEDFGGNVFLFAKMLIGEQEMELQLDTGSGRGLAISEEFWEQMPDNVKQEKLKRGKELYPYIGNLSCRRGVAKNLAIGDKTVHDVPVSVFADDSPLVEDCGGLMGMELFRDATIVLDFENELMWVKRS